MMALKSNADASTLGSMPAEVVCRIAVHCDGKTAIALSKCSRSLHSCYSWLVFKEIVIRELGSADDRSHGDSLGDLEGPKGFKVDMLCHWLQQDADSWARYAVALNRAITMEKYLLTQDKNDWTFPWALSGPLLEGYLCYMPQLLCFGYKPHRDIFIAVDTYLAMFLSEAPNWDKETLVGADVISNLDTIGLEALGFCFAVETMSKVVQNGSPRRCSSRYMTRLVARSQAWTRNHSEIIAAILYLLECSYGAGPPFFRPRAPKTPPQLSQFPFLYTCRPTASPALRHPFYMSGRSASPLGDSPKDSILGTPEFASLLGIEGDEWEGYHFSVFNGRFSIVPLDPSTLKLAFKRDMDDLRSQEQDIENPPISSTETSGIMNNENLYRPNLVEARTSTASPDGDLFSGPHIPDFIICGELRNGSKLEGSGALTAFGLVGYITLKREMQFEISGPFWLWKKDWCEIKER